MRNRRLSVTSLAEGNIIIRIPVNFEPLNENGLLGWKAGQTRIVSPIGTTKTKRFFEDSLKNLPTNFFPAEDEIIIEIPFSYESTEGGKLGWKVGTAIISTPANRDQTIMIIRKKLNL